MSEMKITYIRRTAFLITISFVLATGALAQRPQTFDIATFQAPAGWTTKIGSDSVQISTEDNADAFCLITVFRSVPGLGVPKDNFDAAWETIVKDAVSVSVPPQVSGPSPADDGWEAMLGIAPFAKAGVEGVATLVTVSGYGKMVNVLILTNTDAYQKDIDNFVQTAKLKKPKESVNQPATKSDNSAIVGQWGVSVSPQDSFSVNNGINGYTTRQYTFNPNGTYEFMTKLFAYTSRELLFTRETGTYELSGNALTLTPQKGTIQAWTKAMVTGGDGKPAETDKWGKLVKTQVWPLEKVTYEIEKEFMSGTEKWQLRMKSSNPTRRDGPFSGSSAWANTYFYETMRFPIDPPR